MRKRATNTCSPSLPKLAAARLASARRGKIPNTAEPLPVRQAAFAPSSSSLRRTLPTLGKALSTPAWKSLKNNGSLRLVDFRKARTLEADLEEVKRGSAWR